MRLTVGGSGGIFAFFVITASSIQNHPSDLSLLQNINAFTHAQQQTNDQQNAHKEHYYWQCPFVSVSNSVTNIQRFVFLFMLIINPSICLGSEHHIFHAQVLFLCLQELWSSVFLCSIFQCWINAMHVADNSSILITVFSVLILITCLTNLIDAAVG